VCGRRCCYSQAVVRVTVLTSSSCPVRATSRRGTSQNRPRLLPGSCTRHVRSPPGWCVGYWAHFRWRYGAQCPPPESHSVPPVWPDHGESGPPSGGCSTCVGNAARWRPLGQDRNEPHPLSGG